MIKKFAYIDALRGLAVLGVIMVHVGLRYDNLPSWITPITDQGARGVQSFFILSALTLFLSMKQRTTLGEFGQRDFLIRRFFRIAPLFYLAAIIYSARDVILNHFSTGGYQDFELLPFTSTFLLVTNGLNPSWINLVVPGGWSITVEMTFYLFVPLLFRKIKSLKGSIVFTAFTFLIAFFANYVYTIIAAGHISENKLDSYLFYWFPNQLPVFSLGILVYFLIEKTQKINLSKKLGYAGIVAAIISLLLLPFLSIPNHINHFVFSLIFVMLVWLFSKINIPLFINKITILIGKLSFSMYLTHFLVIQVTGAVVSRLGLNSVLELITLYLLTVMVTVGVSYVSYNLIEKPGIRLGNEIIKRLNKKVEITKVKNSLNA